MFCMKLQVQSIPDMKEREIEKEKKLKVTLVYLSSTNSSVDDYRKIISTLVLMSYDINHHPCLLSSSTYFALWDLILNLTMYRRYNIIYVLLGRKLRLNFKVISRQCREQ